MTTFPLSGSGGRYPSPIYVFVVLSLAAFLALFVIWRAPGITYLVQATIHFEDLDGQALPALEVDRLSQQVLAQAIDPQHVLEDLRSAGMLGDVGDDDQDRKVADEISSRMDAQFVSRGGRNEAQVSIASRNPSAARLLLDTIAYRVASESTGTLVPVQAEIVDQRGGSVRQGQLMLLGLLSSLVGFVGVVLAQRSRPAQILRTEREVTEVTGLPVLESFATRDMLSSAGYRDVARRVFRASVVAAELGVAAVFALMVYQFATREAFSGRFYHDPFAAYGEVLSRFIG